MSCNIIDRYEIFVANNKTMNLQAFQHYYSSTSSKDLSSPEVCHLRFSEATVLAVTLIYFAMTFWDIACNLSKIL